MLSFNQLCSLAARVGIPAYAAWLLPVAVDGTIVQATEAIIALAAYARQQRNRRFFWDVLAAAVSVSVGGNILYAMPVALVPEALSAVIATVAPLSSLATTHGLAILTRFHPEEEK